MKNIQQFGTQGLALDLDKMQQVEGLFTQPPTNTRESVSLDMQNRARQMMAPFEVNEPDPMAPGFTPNPSVVPKEYYDELDNVGGSYLQSKEGGDNSWTQKNMAGSSAYGRYQIMPSTGKWVAGRIGIDPNQWDTPQNQNKIMTQLKSDYSKGLKSIGVEDTEKNRYAFHQLGGERAKRLFSGTLTDSDVGVMYDNLPGSLKSKATDKESIIALWTQTYNR